MNDLYRNRLAVQGTHMGDVLKKQSDTIMNQTFKNDIAYRVVYIDGKPIDAKYITYTYYSIDQDAVDYHLQFRPGIHFPIGKYVDIPDDTGKYNRWLIVGRSDEPQFVKYNVLKCNWTFKWIANGTIYECLGVLRNRNSYNSGLWNNFYMTSVENQNSFWCPSTPEVQTITYNMRFLISDNKINPIAWEVSKTEDTNPVGITKVILKQDFFDPNRDNKELMIADYYKSNIEPEQEETMPLKKKVKIKYSASPVIKVGGSYKAFAAVSCDEQDETVDEKLISWKVNGLIEGDEYFSILSLNTIKIKAAKNYNLIGKVFTVTLFYDGVEADTIEVEVVSL